MKKIALVIGITAAFGINSAQADQVILDDLIVDGSICLGMDCVNGESFGFDTIRLKENNLRIKFEDTSTTSSFPSRDWQITVNDSANGGLNKFSIDDIDGGRTPFTIEAGAPSHSLYVDDSGRLGLGTSTPVVDVHLKSGNTPTTRLEQDGSSGFTAQTWDVAGNEANFFIRDATNGSTLPFRIEPGSPSNALYVDSTGNIGMGTASPSTHLEVGANATTGTTIKLTYADSSYGEYIFNEGATKRWSVGSSGNTDFFYLFNYSNNRTDFVIDDATGYIGLGGLKTPSEPIEHANGATLAGGTTWTNASSRSLKHDIQKLPIAVAMATLGALNPVTFRYNNTPTDQTVGFIAEDVPESVATPDHKGLSPMDIVAVLTTVVKEQQAAIEKLEKMILDGRKER